MNKQEMAAGFAEGRELVQEEGCDDAEIQAADECLVEARCTLHLDWTYIRGAGFKIRVLRGWENATSQVEVIGGAHNQHG